MRTTSRLIWSKDHIRLVLGPHKIAISLKLIEHLFVRNGDYIPHSHVPLAAYGQTADSIGLALKVKLTQSCFPSQMNVWPLASAPFSVSFLSLKGPNIHAVTQPRTLSWTSLPSLSYLFF